MAEPSIVTYKITVSTSEFKEQTEESQTDVLLTLFGSSGQTKAVTLNLDKNKNCQDFESEDINVGTFSKINLAHTITDGGVLISKIDVTKAGNLTSFKVNKWLEMSGDKSLDFAAPVPSRATSTKSQKSIKKPTSAKTVESKSTKKSEIKSKPVANNTTSTVTTSTLKKEEPLGNRSLAKKLEKPLSESSCHTEGQGRMKPENKPIKNGDFELATHVELKRVKTKLYKEVAKVKYPRRKDYHPFVFNDLTPYTETRLAENLICSSQYNQPLGHCNRFTAMTIVEPWVSHRMEHTIGPLVSRSLTHNARSKVSSKKQLNQPGQYEGSTLAPNFPKVIIKKPKGMNGPFYYDDVEIIRSEFQKNFKNKARFEEDRNRTINDYYRMNLDQTSESLHMSGAYNAYLKNTPGSKKALEELLAKVE